MTADSAARPPSRGHRTRRRRPRALPTWQLALAGLALFGVTAGAIYYYFSAHRAVVAPPAAAASAEGTDGAARALSQTGCSE